MKTHILQLEPYDDIISTRDKMGWGKTGRLLLVWPKKGRVLNRRLDLILLQRHAGSLGAQLALVTRDSDVRYHAPRLGIPVFTSLRKAQSAPWRVPRRFRSAGSDEFLTEFEPRDRSEIEELAHSIPSRDAAPGGKLPPVLRLVFFTLGVCAFLAIAATLLPSANVTLVPETRAQEVLIDVSAKTGLSEISLAGLVPLRQVIVSVEGRSSLPVSGAVEIPDKPAAGFVYFANLSDQPVMVPEGTVVRSIEPQVVRFKVTRAGEAPAGPEEGIALPIEALFPGSVGNLPAESLVAIEGALGTQLSVTNRKPTRFGAERQELAPTEDDRQQLFTQLRASLEETALDELEASLNENDLLITSSLTLVNILEENYQPEELQPADQLELGLRLEFEAQTIAVDDLQALAKAVLDTNLPVGFAPLDKTLTIEHLNPPVSGENSTIQWKLRAHRQLQAAISQSHAVRLTLGLEPFAAAERLETTLLLDSPPEITLTPTWWPRLPILPFRITITVLESSSPGTR